MSAIQLYDDNGLERFSGKAVGGGGSQPNVVTLLGPFVVLESDVELTLWTPAVGDVLIDIWVEVVTTFTGSGQVEIYTGSRDMVNAGSVNALVAANNTSQDATRRWSLEDWRASTFVDPGTATVPTSFRTTDPVLADVINNGAGAGVAHIYALVATPA